MPEPLGLRWRSWWVSGCFALMQDMRHPQTSSANHARDRYKTLDHATKFGAPTQRLSQIVRCVLEGKA